MNKKLLFLPLIGCALFASCTEEGVNDRNNQTELPKQAQGKTVTFKAEPLSVETKSLSTKVEVVPNGNNDDLKWTNETVSFFFVDGAAKKIYTDEADVSVSLWGAEMDVTVPEDAGTYDIYAISPSGSYFTTGTTTLTIDNQTQNGNDLSHLSPNIFLYSNPSTKLVVDENKNSTGDIPLSFDILSSLIRFDVINSSNTDVTLNSITIKFDGGGTLYKTATLNDINGALSYGMSDETYSEMTLTLNNAYRAASVTTPFAAYMAAFPSNGSGDLLIDLNITANDRPETIKYKFSNIEITKGQRLYVGLDLNNSDFPAADGYFYMQNGENYYRTYEFPTTVDGRNQIWMTQNSIEQPSSWSSIGSGAFYTRDNASSACITPWRVPSADEVGRLLTYLSALDNLSVWFHDSEIIGYFSPHFGSFQSTINAQYRCDPGLRYIIGPAEPYFSIPGGSDSVMMAGEGYYVRCVRDTH